MHRKLCISVFLHVIPLVFYAQVSGIDSSFRQAAISNVISFYHRSVGNASNLYNGTEYDVYQFPFIENHQYFGASSFIRGNVQYNEVLYTNVPLRYDIVRDELVLLHYDSIHNISLVKEKVAFFTIGENNFVCIVQDSLQRLLSTGFYQQLHAGKVSLLQKHVKRLEEIIDQQAVFSRIFYRKFFYLQKDGAYYAVKNKKDLLRLLQDKKSELQKYIKQEKLNFKRDASGAMTKLVAHYDQLIK